MNNNILKTGVQDFISKKWNTDIMSVLLKKPVFKDISPTELAQQLEGKKKCREKLPTWFDTPQIYFPKKINIEQTSSEQTAAYKSNLVNGKILVDITGGLGVDSFFFSKKIRKVIHCEIDAELSEIAEHNFKILGDDTIEVINLDGLAYLSKTDKKIDWVYTDPSRRDSEGRRVFQLKDTIPNIPEHLEVILSKTENLLLKTAPLLDISLGLSELTQVKEVHVVAIKNEVKELLWVIKKGFIGEPKIIAVNLKGRSHEQFEFFPSEEKEALSDLGQPGQYLYEPHAAILKAGAFKSIGAYYGLNKLHEHSHLYTSSELIDFPGRVFKITSVHAFNKKEIKQLNIEKANIATRNFKESVASIRKKLTIKDGGDDYLFFTKDLNGKAIMLRCEKLKN